MKKLMLMTAMIVFTGMAGFTQSFEKGSSAINLGIGFVNTPYIGTSYYEGFFPGASASYEYGIARIPIGNNSGVHGVVGIGPYGAFTKTNYNFFDNGDHYDVYDLTVGLRGNFHFVFHEKFDPYVGVWIGGDFTSHKWDGGWEEPEGIYFAHNSGLAAGAYAGARWFFTDNIAVYGEFGWLASIVNLGVSFKF
jgi:hypothetical protein